MVSVGLLKIKFSSTETSYAVFATQFFRFRNLIYIVAEEILRGKTAQVTCTHKYSYSIHIDPP
jgi:hypothetical protein